MERCHHRPCLAQRDVEVGRRGLATLGQVLANGEQAPEWAVVQRLGEPAAFVVGHVEHLAEQPRPVRRKALHFSRAPVGRGTPLRHRVRPLERDHHGSQ